jgi:multiple sugar transport system substrate-binding protein
MKKFQVILCIPVALVFLGGAVFASGGGQSGGEKNIKLSFLNVFPIDETNAHYAKYLKEYNTSHPNVTIEYTTVPWDEAFKKVVAMATSNSLPDMLTGDVSYMLALAANNKVIDLLPAWKASGYYGDLSPATTLSSDLYMYQGKVLAIPDGHGAQAIYANVRYLESAGYNVEELRKNFTWEKYFEVIKRTTKPANNEYGISFRGGQNGFSRFFEYLANRLHVDTIFPNGNRVSILEDPKALGYFKEFYGLYKDGYAPKDSITWGFKEMVEGFVSGQTATLNNSAEVTVTCHQRMKDGDWTALPFPKNSDGSKTAMIWGHSAGLMVSADSRNVETATDVVMYLSSPDVNAAYCKALVAMPIYKSKLNSPDFQSGDIKGFADTLSDPNLQYLKQPTELTQWGYFLSEYATGECQKYMSGAQTAEVTLSNMAKWLSGQYDKDMGISGNSG